MIFRKELIELVMCLCRQKDRSKISDEELTHIRKALEGYKPKESFEPGYFLED